MTSTDFFIVTVVLIVIISGQIESFTPPLKPRDDPDIVFKESRVPAEDWVLYKHPDTLEIFNETRHLFWWDTNYIESVRLTNNFLHVIESLKNLKSKTDNPEVIKRYFDKLRRTRNDAVNKYNSLFVSNPEISQKAYYKKLYGVNALWRNLIKKEEEIYQMYEFKSFISPMPYRKLRGDQYFIH